MIINGKLQQTRFSSFGGCLVSDAYRFVSDVLGTENIISNHAMTTERSDLCMVNTQHPYPAPGISNSTLGVLGPLRADSKQAAGAGLRHAAHLMPTSRRVDGRQQREIKVWVSRPSFIFSIVLQTPPPPAPIILTFIV